MAGGHIGFACMWREYLGYAGTTFAVINGVIAIVIAMLPVRRSVHKLRLGATALVLSAFAIGATVYSKYHAYAEIERQQAGPVEIRKSLGGYISEGQELLRQIKDPQRELPTKPADEWALRTETYLRDKLGERYVPRFRQDVNELYGDAATIAPARLGYWRAVRNRVVSLEMIAAEFPEQPRQRP